MDQTTSDKSRDQHARRRVRRLGYVLWKARPTGQWGNHASYTVIEPQANVLVAGPMRIDDVETWLDGAEKPGEVPATTS